MSNELIVTIHEEIEVPEGIYVVGLEKIEFVKGRFDAAYKMHYFITRGEYEGCRAIDLVNKGRGSSNSKLATIIQKITKNKYKFGESIDLNTLVGKLVKVRLEKKDKVTVVAEYVEGV